MSLPPEDAVYQRLKSLLGQFFPDGVGPAEACLISDGLARMSGEILAPYDESAWVQFGKLVREHCNSYRVEARIAPVGVEVRRPRRILDAALELDA